MTTDGDGELRRLGATDEEISRARAAGALPLLAVAHAALPGGAKYTGAELAAAAGMDYALARRFWRALGFPDVPPDERAFTDADVEALATVRAILDVGLAGIEEAVQMTRVIGSSMNRIAEAMVTTRPRTLPPEAADVVAAGAQAMLTTQSRLLEYVWRRHLAVALRRQLLARLDEQSGGGHGDTVAIGFADLVGFTAMSQQLDYSELAQVVARFESMAFDEVAARGGRVAKMIGDEAMFAVHDVGAAVDIGLSLADAYASDDVLSDVRVGIASGAVLMHEGDYYGPVVNVASRIVGIAVPGSVVVSADVCDALDTDARFVFHALRPRYLKDIGRVRLWRARRS